MKIIPRILILLALQTSALAAMVGMKQHTLMTGTSILLQTEPIDPRSLFRGDYVRLNYSISQLNLAEVEGDDDFERYDTVYVVLAPGEKYWQPVSVHHELPAVSAQQVAIEGEAGYISEQTWDRATDSWRAGKTLQVRYGIENYFVPEGKGLELELRPRDQIVDIRVAVDQRGNAGIQAVLVDGEERYVEKLWE